MKNTTKMPQQSSVHPISQLSTASLRAASEGKPVSVPWVEQLPLTPEATKPTLPPIDALGIVLGPVAQKVVAVVQCPVGIALFSFLAAANLAVQDLVDVEVDGRIQPVSNFYLSIASSGQRKSGADYWAMKPYRVSEKSGSIEYSEALEQYRLEKRTYEAAEKNIQKGNADFHAKIEQIKALGGEPLEPVLPWILCQEPTIEGLLRLLDKGRGSVGLFSDEGGKFIGGHGMSAESKLRMFTGLSGLWDSGTADKTRAGEGMTRLFDKRLSMHLMCQDGVAKILLNDKDAQDQGILARCLVSASEPTKKIYVEEDISKDPAIISYQNRVLELLPAYKAKPGELQRKQLRLSPDAKLLYMSFHDGIQQKKLDGAYGSAAAHAEKAHDIALRLSAVLHVFDYWILGEQESLEVGYECFERAMAIVAYSLAEQRRLGDETPVSDKYKKAGLMLEWMRKKQQQTFSKSEMMQLGPSSLRSKDELECALAVLCEHGYVRPTKASGKFDAWELRPV